MRKNLAFGTMLAMLTASAPLVQHGIPALAPRIVERFDLSLTELGSYSTLLFGVSAVLSPFMGRLSDRVSVYRLATILLVMASVGAVVVMVAPNFPVILVSVIFTCIPLSLAHPVSNRLLVSHTFGKTQSILLAVKHSGVKLAQATAGYVMAPLAAFAGWRMAFSIPLLLPILSCFWIPRFIKGLKNESDVSERIQRSSAPFLTVWLMLYSVFMATGQSGTATYIAVYAFDELSFSVSGAGSLVGFLGVLGVGARVFWGLWAHKFKYAVWPLQITALGCIVGTGSVIVSPSVGSAFLWFATGLLGVTTAVWNLVVTMVVFAVIPSGNTGRATGRIYFGFCVGMMLGPILFGAIVDIVGVYEVAWFVVGASQLFGLLVSIPVYWYVDWRKPRSARSEG